jgi:hypothetical protein
MTNPLVIERRNIKAEIRRLQQINRELNRTYYDMEGMYAEKVWDEDVDPHFRPYHFEYRAEMKEKEEADREQFLVDNGYYTNEETMDALRERWEEIDDLLCREKHGMSSEKYSLLCNIKSMEKNIKDYEEMINHYQSMIASLKIGIAECQKEFEEKE